MHRFLTAMVVFSLAPAGAAGAQETPEALGTQFLQAVAAGDEEALRGLIHPASVRSLAPARVEQVLEAWLRLEPEPTWGTKSVAGDSLSGYEPGSLTYMVGPIEITFPTTPERFLMVLFTRPVEPGSSATITGEKTRDAIARVDGQWRILIGDVRRVPGAGQPLIRF